METTWWTQPEQLDATQRQVVALPIDESHLIVGPPGSGKTNLLILRAAHLYGSGKKHIAILAFGRVLREFLASGSNNYIFPPTYIKTYVKWAIELLKENGIQVDDSAQFDHVRKDILQGLKRLKAQRNPENVLDCILIDEVQDYTAEEVEIISSFAKRIVAVGDARQSIYNTSGAIESLRAKVDQSVELPFHYRNGISICRVADGIMNQIDDADGLEETSNYDEGAYPSTVLRSDGLSIEEQVRAAIPEIATQLRAYPDGIIGCLCPRNSEVDVVWDEIQRSSLAASSQLQKFSDGYAAFDTSRRIVVTTIHGAKGLEFRALHLLGMDMIPRFQDRQRRLAYTAVTRAKTSLSIYHDDSLPGYLERGLAAARDEVPEEPSLANLFKSGKV